MRHGDNLAHVAVRGRGLMARRPELIAHRGANREAPENTIRAFELALAIGVDGIELDIQQTLDGIPVVHHDPSLAAGSQGAGPARIASLTLAAVRDRADVATLDEVLEVVGGRSGLYIEIKDPAAVAAVVQRTSVHADWCAVHSFDHRVSALVRALDARLPTGILLVSRLVDTVGAMRAARARDVWQHVDYIDQALADEVHAADGRLIAWTVNDVAMSDRLVAMGIDGVCTDAARVLRPEMMTRRV